MSICFTNVHGRCSTVLFFSPLSWLVTEFVTAVTRRMPLVQQEMRSLQEHLSSPPVISCCFFVVALSSVFLCNIFVFCLYCFSYCIVCLSTYDSFVYSNFCIILLIWLKYQLRQFPPNIIKRISEIAHIEYPFYRYIFFLANSKNTFYINIIVTVMEGNIRIYRLPKGCGTDQWKYQFDGPYHGQSVYPDIALHGHKSGNGKLKWRISLQF